jgi:hypothetical protein
MKELIALIEKTDTETGDNLQQLYKEIVKSWEQLNK